MKWFTFGLIGLLSCLVFVVISAPASLLVGWLEEDITKNVPEVTLGATRGSIWEGSQQLKYRQLPTVLLSWELSILPLVTGIIHSENQLHSDSFSDTPNNNLEAEFSLELSKGDSSLTDGAASITGRYLNHLTVPLGLDLSETFTINHLNIAWTSHWVTSISGNISWPGGIVHIETPQGLHTAKLPALAGELSLLDNAVRLHVSGADTELMNIRLKADGWATVEINYQLITMLGIPLSDDQQAYTGPAVLLEEKVF